VRVRFFLLAGVEVLSLGSCWHVVELMSSILTVFVVQDAPNIALYLWVYLRCHELLQIVSNNWLVSQGLSGMS